MENDIEWGRRKLREMLRRLVELLLRNIHL